MTSETTRLTIRLTTTERAALERLAAREKTSLSAWVRHRLLVDLAGQALAGQIVQVLQEKPDERLAKVAEAVEQHREDFEQFRANLSRALEGLTRQVWAAARGGKEPNKETIK